LVYGAPNGLVTRVKPPESKVEVNKEPNTLRGFQVFLKPVARRGFISAVEIRVSNWSFPSVVFLPANPPQITMEIAQPLSANPEANPLRIGGSKLHSRAAQHQTTQMHATVVHCQPSCLVTVLVKLKAQGEYGVVNAVCGTPPDPN